MPEDFLRCVKAGGKVRTKKLKDGKYIKICFLNGKSYAGEVHEGKKEKLIEKKRILRKVKNKKKVK